MSGLETDAYAGMTEAAQASQEAKRQKERERVEREEKRKNLAKNIHQISMLLAESNAIAMETRDIHILVCLSDATSRLFDALNFAQGHGC